MPDSCNIIVSRKFRSQMPLRLDDSRWWNGDFEAFKLVEEKEAVPVAYEPPSGLALADALRCTTCDVDVGDDRFSLVIHYRSDWHKHNLRRKLHGKPVLTEEEFEEKLSEKEDGSDSLSSGTEDSDTSAGFSGGAYEYFVHSQNVYSIYNCILRDKEQPSSSFFARPLNCTILLLAGGHFGGGVFKDDQLIAHKTFHRYTVRAKQGGAQSASDARQGKAKSAGATLRRYNEKALREDVQEVLSSWSSIINNSPLVFIRSPTYNRSMFISDSLQRAPFLKSDDRLRTIPFEVRRPSIDELMRIWQRLRVVREHGKIEEFRKEVEERKNLKKKRTCLLPNRQARKEGTGADNLSSEEETAALKDVQKKSPKPFRKDATKKDTKEVQQPLEEKKDVDRLTEEQKQTIYLAVRTDSVEKLRAFLEEHPNKRQYALDYLNLARFAPDRASFLHLAVKREAENVLNELLLLGCDPSVKDVLGYVPYDAAPTRALKRIFSEFRSKNPEKWNWHLCRIPEPKVVSEEKQQKEAEKRKQQKERRKLREKTKKDEERIEKEKQAEQDAFLVLSDREKRALAAERRLAASMQKSPELVPNDGNRCFQCGRVLPAKPFEYSDNKFCQIPCVIQHRRANQNTTSK